jgi:hypothetical protein
MSCLGVHFALTDDDVSQLLSRSSDAERLEFLQEELEVRYFEEPQTYLAESDKAWDAMHRALTDGLLDHDGGKYPLNHVVLGGQLIYSGDDYIMSLKTPAQVNDIAAAILQYTEEQFRARYDAIDPDRYGLALSDEDFSYTWEWFQVVRQLYQIAASEGRHVLFSVDQ